MKPIKNIVFIDHEDNVQSALAYCRENDDCLLIALNSMVMWELEKRGQTYRIPYDYYNTETLLDLKEDLYDLTEKICDHLDNQIIDLIPFFKQKKYKPAHAFFFQIKTALNTVCHSLINIIGVLDSENPKKVIFFETKQEELNFDYYLDPVKYSVYSKLIKTVAKKKNISRNNFQSKANCTKLSLSSQKINWGKLRDEIRRLKSAYYRLKTHFKLLNLFQKNKTNLQVKKIIGPSLKILVFNPGYSISLLVRFMKNFRVGKIVDINKELRSKNKHAQLDINEQFNKLWNALKEDQYFNQLFTVGEVNLLTVINDYLHHILIKGSVDIINIYDKVTSMLRRERPDIYLLPTITSVDSWATTMVIKKAGIPVVTWQHGSYAMFDPHTQPVQYDIKNADHFFVFGEGVRDAYFEEGKRWNTKIVPIGSIVLDKIKTIKKKTTNNTRSQEYISTKTVLVPLRMLTSGAHIPLTADSHLFYPIDIYWRELQKMLLLFAKFSNLKFVLKLHSSNSLFDNPILDFLKTNNIHNTTVKGKPNFKSLLPISFQPTINRMCC